MHNKTHEMLEESLHYIMRNPIKDKSIEYNDNRISLYMGQQGTCAITGKILEIGKMHCHHMRPEHLGGTNEYKNLIFITDKVHRLIHATDQNTISKYLKMLSLNEKQLNKSNQLREQAGLKRVELNKVI